MFRLEFDVERLADHGRDLFLRSRTAAADCDLRLGRCILGNRDSAGRTGDYRRSLGSTQLQHRLGILAKEWGLYGHVRRLIHLDQLAYSSMDVRETLERIIDLAQVENSHGKIVRSLGINTDNPETQELGSGIYSEYDSFFSQSCRSLCKDAEPQE